MIVVIKEKNLAKVFALSPCNSTAEEQINKIRTRTEALFCCLIVLFFLSFKSEKKEKKPVGGDAPRFSCCSVHPSASTSSILSFFLCAKRRARKQNHDDDDDKRKERNGPLLFVCVCVCATAAGRLRHGQSTPDTSVCTHTQQREREPRRKPVGQPSPKRTKK